MTEPVEKPEEKWPGVESAYGFVIPSYQWMVTRIESADSRIQTLVAFVATVTFAIPAVGKSLDEKISLLSAWFIVALVIAAAVIVTGTVARSTGSLTLANPQVFYEKWLQKSQWEFQKDMLHFAGKHFEANAVLVNRKAAVLAIMTLSFLAELTLLALWVTTG